MEGTWLILGRTVRVPQAQAGRGAGAEAQLKERVTEVDMEEVAADAAQAGRAAAKPDFTISVKPPPLVTFLTAGISHPNPPAKPDKKPCILASGPFCLLTKFSAVPPREPGKFYLFSPPSVSHLVVVRHFRYVADADGRIAASAELVPDRGDDLPELLYHNVDSVGILCDDNDRSYLIAELQITAGTDSLHDAVLVCYRSVVGAWSRNTLDVPLPPMPKVDRDRDRDGYGYGDSDSDRDRDRDRDRDHDLYRYRKWVPHGAVALDSTLVWFDLSWGLLSLDFNLQKSDFRLEFSALPPGRELGPREVRADVYGRRCITVSGNLLRFVEIIAPNGEAPTVCMWCRRRRPAGVNGWEWALNYRVSFDEIWRSDSYIETGLQRNVVPMLACVSPVDPNVVYFTLHLKGRESGDLFGLHVPDRRVVHREPTELPSNSRFLAWNLRPSKEKNFGILAPQQHAAHPGN